MRGICLRRTEVGIRAGGYGGHIGYGIGVLEPLRGGNQIGAFFFPGGRLERAGSSLVIREGAWRDAFVLLMALCEVTP